MKGIIRKLRSARNAAQSHLSKTTGSGFYARGLSGEGFVGGYIEALDDVEAMLTHGCPEDRRGFWKHQPKEPKDD